MRDSMQLTLLSSVISFMGHTRAGILFAITLQTTAYAAVFPGGIIVQVVDGVTNLGVDNAIVELGGDPTSFTETTNANGTAAFLNILPGMYSLYVTKAGYQPFTLDDIAIEAGQTSGAALLITRESSGATISGLIRIANSDDFVADVPILLDGLSIENAKAETQSASSVFFFDNFWITDLPGDEVAVSALSEDFLVGESTTTATIDEITPIELAAVAKFAFPYTIVGTVIDNETSNPAEDTLVRVSEARLGEAFYSRTNESGLFTILLPRDGWYTAKALEGVTGDSESFSVSTTHPIANVSLKLAVQVTIRDFAGQLLDNYPANGSVEAIGLTLDEAREISGALCECMFDNLDLNGDGDISLDELIEASQLPEDSPDACSCDERREEPTPPPLSCSNSAGGQSFPCRRAIGDALLILCTCTALSSYSRRWG